MAELFDAQRDSAELQGDIERLKTAHGKRVSPPSSEPIVHTNPQGDVVDRAGKILIPKREPFALPQEKK
jgi:hypothetical protein